MSSCCKERRSCVPRCKRRCVKTFEQKYKVYETCCYDIYKVCCRCGREYNVHISPGCPHCGFMMKGDHPHFGGLGWFG